MAWTEKIRKRFIMRKNRIYIMPTRAGILYLGCILVLILSAATYNNNLIFILAFFLFALFAVTALKTHFNIKGVRLEFASAGEVFAGDPLDLSFRLFELRPRFKFSLKVRGSSRAWKTLVSAEDTLTPTEMVKVMRVSLMTETRGVHPLPEMILETFYPLGIFRAWKVIRPDGQVIVYPKAEGGRVLNPVQYESGAEELGLRPSPEGDFGELKAYRTGESYHQIAWKQYARTYELFSKVHWGEEHHHYHIPWDPRGEWNEAYLSQMSEWIRHAVDENATFEMDIPDGKIEAGSGPDQARLCWRALAGLKEKR